MTGDPIPDGGIEIPLRFTGLEEGRTSAEAIFNSLTSNADRLQSRLNSFRTQMMELGRATNPWMAARTMGSSISSPEERLRAVGYSAPSSDINLQNLLSRYLHPTSGSSSSSPWLSMTTREGEGLADVFRRLRTAGGNLGDVLSDSGKRVAGSAKAAFDVFRSSAFGRSLGLRSIGPDGKLAQLTPDSFARALGRFMAARSVGGLMNAGFEYAKNPLHDNYRVNAAQRSVNSTINTLATTGSPTAAIISGLTSLAMSGIERRNQMMRTDYNFAQQSLDTRRSVAEQKSDWAFNAMLGMRSRGEQIRMIRARAGRIRGIQDEDTIADDIANANDRIQIARQRLNEALGIRPVHEKNTALQSVHDSRRIAELEKKKESGTILTEDEKKELDRLKRVVALSQKGTGAVYAHASVAVPSPAIPIAANQSPVKQPASAKTIPIQQKTAAAQTTTPQQAASGGLGNVSTSSLPVIPNNLQGVQKQLAEKAKAEFDSAMKALEKANQAKAFYSANKPESGETTVPKLLNEIKENERIIGAVMDGSYNGKDPGKTADRLRERNRTLQEMVGNLMQANPTRYAFGLGNSDRLRVESMAWEKTDLSQVFEKAGRKGDFEKEINAVKKALGKGENDDLSFMDLQDSANKTKIRTGRVGIEAHTLEKAFWKIPNIAKQKLEQYDQDVIGKVQQGLFKNKDMSSLKEALEIAKENGINIDSDANFKKIKETYLGQERRAETLEFQSDKLKYDPSQILSAYTDASRTTDTMARQGWFVGGSVDVMDVNRDILSEFRKAIPLLEKMAQKEVSYSDVGLSPSSMFK